MLETLQKLINKGNNPKYKCKIQLFPNQQLYLIAIVHIETSKMRENIK